MNFAALTLLILLFLQPPEAKGAEIVIDDYSMGTLARSESKSFEGTTLRYVDEVAGADEKSAESAFFPMLLCLRHLILWK